MFSKNYFKYLLIENKLLIIFVTLISSLFCFSNNSEMMICLITLLLTYAMPMMVFKYIHDSKAVDSYFSLPVSRKALLITGLLFSIMAVYLPFVISNLVSNLIYHELSFVSFLGYMELGLIVVSTLVCFNTMLYQVANNAFDGIVVICAYSLLPFFVYVVVGIFFEVFVCGHNFYNSEFLGYLSPVFSGALLMIRHFDSYEFSLNINDYKYLLSLVIFLVSSCGILIKSFPNRKVERANEPSSNFFAYPLIIYLYTLLCLFGISCNYSYNYDLSRFLREYTIFYVVCFALFVLAHFVYKRKFYFNIKMLIFFICSLALSVIFCFASIKTNGFGICYKDELPDTYVRYTLNIFSENKEIDDYVYEKTGGILEHYIVVQIDTQDKPINKELLDLLSSYKDIAIDQFYNRGEISRNLTLTVDTHYSKELDYESFENKYNYYLKADVDNLDTLLKLSSYEGVKVYLYTDKAEYLLLQNEDLLAINIYNY